MIGKFCRRARLALVLLGMAGAAQAGNYVLRIGDQEVELDLDTPVNVAIGNGKPASVLLRQKAEQTWRSDGMSFVYSTATTPARTQIDKDITQVALIASSGDSLIVQHYIGINPAHVIDMMVNELTSDEVSAGYKRTTRPATRQLADGATLTGTLVHTERAGDYADREILALGDRSGGYLIIGKTSGEPSRENRQMVERFWRTLRLK